MKTENQKNHKIRKQRTPPARLRHAEQSRMLSRDEKRELILAHAAARAKRPPNWGVGYYIGIAASCLVVATGWWFTLGTDIRQPLPATESFSEIVKNNVQQLQNDLKDSSGQDANHLIQIMKNQYQQALLQEQAMKNTAARIQAATATSSQN